MERLDAWHPSAPPTPAACRGPRISRTSSSNTITASLTDTAQLERVVEQATRDVVKKQVDTGIDIVSDGEYSKVSYVTYVKERLSGFNGPPRNPMGRRPDVEEFPDYDRAGPAAIQFPTNDAKVQLKDAEAVRRDVAIFKQAADEAKPPVPS